ncbi:unnamed protein product, partial [Polarella glacialis]
ESDADEQLSSIFGQVYVCSGDQEQGIASYHFGASVEDDCYISYESERCTQLFPRLDAKSGSEPGERLPKRMPFKRASWNPVSRTFRATASFSRDMGKYEEVVTLDGVEVEEYELVFSEDFEAIVGGECCSFFPNASKPEKCQPFGGQAGTTYARWQRPAVAARLWEDRSCSEEEPRILELSAAAEASVALLERNGRSFRLSLESGDSAQSTVDALQLWQRMRWDPGDVWRSQAQQLTTPLLVAAVLLQWPEGVELCIRFGADVSLCYAGPFRAKGGRGAVAAGNNNTNTPILI